MKSKITTIGFLLMILFSAGVMAQTPAFPTAEGFGKWATGGRGGKVVEVTTLEDDATGSIPGSLRWAVKQHSGQPITIVFRVSGIIDFKGNEFRSKRNNVTYAGQTAPGDGICIKGESFNLGGSFNVIVRNIRFRTGAYTPAGAEVNAASVILENGGNFIFDHCSMSWSAEELCDFSDDDNLTVQWCIFAEGLYKSVNSKGARGYGPVIAGENATYHHNLLASNVTRSPRFGVTSSNDRHVLVDYVNNVNYNFGSAKSCYGGENEMGAGGTEKINFVNNYYKHGPAYTGDRTAYFVRASYEIGAQGTAYTKWHLSGNYIDGSANQRLNTDNYLGLNIEEYTAQVPSCTLNDLKSDHHAINYPVNTETAQDAFNSIMNKAGAYPRDTVDRRVVDEAIKGIATCSGTFNNNRVCGIIDKPEDAGGYPEYKTYNQVTDNDHDGMDDSWETANNLDPNNAEDRNNLTKSGYTMLEVYLCSLMGEKIDIETGNEKINVEEDGFSVFVDKNQRRLIVQGKALISKVNLIDLNGKCVKNFTAPGLYNLNIDSVSNGVYFVVINTESGKVIKKKIIIN